MNEKENYTSLDENSLLSSRKTRMRPASAWWIYSFNQGRTTTLGPYFDKEEAERDVWAKLSGEGEVVELSTIDRAAARDMLRKRTLDRTSDLETALRRQSHQGKGEQNE